MTFHNVTDDLTEHFGECELNNSFGIGVQAVLAFTAFCILILKRLREPAKERRPVKIWFCDTSKQGIGTMLIHFANVALASWSAKDPCTWYFINYVLDTTIGLVVIWFLLRVLHCVAVRKGWVKLRMGDYGSPPHFRTWFFQCLAYIGVMCVEKVVILCLFQLSFWTTVKKFILKPISAYPRFELIVVMLIVPFIMNALMFWVVDNFLMQKHRRLLTDPTDNAAPVLYVNGKKQKDNSDDEAALCLIGNESRESLNEDSLSSDYENLHRRIDVVGSR